MADNIISSILHYPMSLQCIFCTTVSCPHDSHLPSKQHRISIRSSYIINTHITKLWCPNSKFCNFKYMHVCFDSHWTLHNLQMLIANMHFAYTCTSFEDLQLKTDVYPLLQFLFVILQVTRYCNICHTCIYYSCGYVAVWLVLPNGRYKSLPHYII